MKRPPVCSRSALLSALAIGAAALLLACNKPAPPPGASATSPAADGAVTPPGGPPPSDPPPGDPPAGDRKAAVPADHPLYGRLEGTAFPNDCKSDAECFVEGCSSETCSAEKGLMSTCEALTISFPAGTACGCVQGQCIWWNGSGEVVTDQSAPKGGVSGKCGDKVCTPPQQCLEYYGIAGPRGPKFQTCEIPCRPAKGGCPDGTKCVTIADGPGSVCR